MIVLKHRGILALVQTVKGNDAGSKRLDMPPLDDNGLLTVTTQELPIFFRAAGNFVNYHNHLAPFQAPTMYTSARTFLKMTTALSAITIQTATGSFINFLNALCFHTHTTCILRLQILSSADLCISIIRAHIGGLKGPVWRLSASITSIRWKAFCKPSPTISGDPDN